MSMKKLMVGLSLLLSISLVPAHSATPPKAGSVCSKQGTTKIYQGKKYTCIKSGKKLVWSKGVVVKTPTPTPTPTTRVKTLLETQLSSAFKSELVRDIPFTLVIENPNLSSKNRFLIEEFKKHLRWLSGIGANITRPLVVIYADTADWMNEEFKRQGCVFAPGWKLPLGGFAIMADCAGKYIITRPNADREAGQSSIETQNGLIHEAFHQWQNQIMARGLDGNDWPKWLIEGGAHAFARYAFWESTGSSSSPDQILVDWFTQDHEFRRLCVGVPIREMVANIPYPQKGWVCAYSKGQVAIDLYIEKHGVESLFTLYRSPKSRGIQDFPALFQGVTGQDLEKFYNEVDIEMKIRGWD